MIEIPVNKYLKPYFKIAETEAHKSLCIRRQYGAVIAYPKTYGDYEGQTDTLFYEASYNIRVSPCCNEFCARDRVNTRHGGSVEIGGEIHAETSVLIKRTTAGNSGYFILVGYEKGKELYGTAVYPCHSCAIGIKFAGYTHIFIRESKDNIRPVSIQDIIAFRIEEWEPVES